MFWKTKTGTRVEFIELPYQTGIIYGLPVRVYEDRIEPTGVITGFMLDILTDTFGFDGRVMVYQGSYWGAIWPWLTTSK